MRDEIRTERLLLRQWRETDRAPFRAINADPRVMEFMPAVRSSAESDASIVCFEQHFELHGFGLFAAELLVDATFAGFIGLSVPAFDAPFAPAVEIGWRLDFDYWGRGLATEGAHAVTHYAFDELSLPGWFPLQRRQISDHDA